MSKGGWRVGALRTKALRPEGGQGERDLAFIEAIVASVEEARSGRAVRITISRVSHIGFLHRDVLSATMQGSSKADSKPQKSLLF